MWDYTEKMMEHFRDPHNIGEIENADGIGEVGSIVCGDALRLTLKIDNKTEKITDAKFQTFGCASAIASSSILTDMVKGMTVDEASNVTNKEIADALGGLPDEKMHCSVMGMEALEKAIADYRGLPTPEAKDHDDPHGEVGEIQICKCFDVSDVKIKRAIEENNLKTVEDVTNYTKAGGGCGSCHPDIEKILNEHWETELTKGEAHPESLLHPEKKLTNLQRIELIKDTIDREVRPHLKADGGDIELIDVDRKIVYVKFLGACLGCHASSVTLGALVEGKLKEFVEDDIVVEEVQ